MDVLGKKELSYALVTPHTKSGKLLAIFAKKLGIVFTKQEMSKDHSFRNETGNTKRKRKPAFTGKKKPR